MNEKFRERMVGWQKRLGDERPDFVALADQYGPELREVFRNFGVEYNESSLCGVLLGLYTSWKIAEMYERPLHHTVEYIFLVAGNALNNLDGASVDLAEKLGEPT